jgi:hypothetical protein
MEDTIRMSLEKLPEELVLLATVHGGVPVENGDVKTFVVPQGVTVSRIMATRPGICNVTSEHQIDRVVQTMGSTPEKTFESLKIGQAEVLKSIAHKLKGNDPQKQFLQQYIRSRIGNPMVKVFNSGDVMMDKMFDRAPHEGLGKAFDFKLNVISMPGIPDLFDLIYFGKSGPAVKTRSKYSGSSVDLSMIVEALPSFGVKHLILLDLTCSSFTSNVPMTERQERDLRKSVLQRGLGTRRRNKKTKTRKAKKQKAQWRH